MNRSRKVIRLPRRHEESDEEFVLEEAEGFKKKSSVKRPIDQGLGGTTKQRKNYFVSHNKQQGNKVTILEN